MTETRKITRIDIERMGDGVQVRQWYEGWQEGSTPADIDEYLPDQKNIPALLYKYEQQGFSVWMLDNWHGRALAGKFTRIDFVKVGDRYLIKKYRYGWKAATPSLESETTPDKWIEAVQWCETMGWTVLHGKTGHRAFRGDPMPVHDKSTILRLRRQHPETIYDLALYGGIL